MLHHMARPPALADPAMVQHNKLEEVQSADLQDKHDSSANSSSFICLY